MKKSNSFNVFVALVLVAVMFSSCATVLGGPITEYQKTKPRPGEPQREIRIGALIVDIIFLPFVIVDFATGAIYKPEPNQQNAIIQPIKEEL